MKKFVCWVLCLVMVLSASAAFAGARMPTLRGVLTDDADVLSAGISSAVQEYLDEVEDETDLDVHVAIVHFFDGLDAQNYANQLFAHWKLKDEAVLLVCAAGEDSFATAMGKKAEAKLGKQNMDNLMYTASEFADMIAVQNYDTAFSRYFVAFNDLVNKRFDEKLKVPKALQQATTVAQQSTFSVGDGFGMWSEIMEAVNDNSTSYTAYSESHDSDSGLGVGGWIILLILIMIIFSQSHPVRKARNQRRRNGNSGGLLSWIFRLVGLGALIKVFRRD